MARIFDSASELIDRGIKATGGFISQAGEAAGDLIAKGKDAAGDIAGSAGELVDKGKVKAKLFDNGLEHDRLMRELGTAVYDQVKNDPACFEANKTLFERIALNIEQRQELEGELYDIEAAADAAKPIDVEPVEVPQDGADGGLEGQETAQAARENEEEHEE